MLERSIWSFHTCVMLLLSSFLCGRVSAATNVSGSITEDARWTAAAGPYVVKYDLTVESGATLTLDPGVVVKFGSCQMSILGTLVADGTPAQPIYFTSLKDDSVGGDTNGDGAATAPAAIDWENLYFAAASAGNVLDNTVVRYAGHTPAEGCIHILSDDTTVSDSTIESNYGEGIYVEGASATITGCTIRDNTGGGIYLDASDATVTANTITGNLDGIRCEAGSEPAVEANRIEGNVSYGLRNMDLSVTVVAEGNWWGDHSGPYHAVQNPAGTGNAVSDGVAFDPWWRTPYFEQDLCITSFTREGYLSWTPTTTTGVIRVFYAPAITGDWTEEGATPSSNTTFEIVVPSIGSCRFIRLVYSPE